MSGRKPPPSAMAPGGPARPTSRSAPGCCCGSRAITPVSFTQLRQPKQRFRCVNCGNRAAGGAQIRTSGCRRFSGSTASGS